MRPLYLAAVLLLSTLISPSLGQGYGSAPAKGKKHRTTTTTTLPPDIANLNLGQGFQPGFNPISSTPVPDNSLGSYNPPPQGGSGSYPPSQGGSGSYWWQNPDSPFSGATAPPPSPQPGQPGYPGPQPGHPGGCGAGGAGGCGGVTPGGGAQPPVNIQGNPFLSGLKPGGGSQPPIRPSGQTVTCSGPGYICAPKHLCSNGVVIQNGQGLFQVRSETQYCDAATQACCRLPSQGNVPSGGCGYGQGGGCGGGQPTGGAPHPAPGAPFPAPGAPQPSPFPSQPASSGSNNAGPGLVHIPPSPSGSGQQYPSASIPSPTYSPTGNNLGRPVPGTNGIPIGGSIYDTTGRPVTQNPNQHPYTGPLNTTPHPGCAAALKCVQETYCTAEGVMSDRPVTLTREQYENRVPLTDCADPDTGVLGKCCRDPNYKDPWPGGMMMKNGVGTGAGQQLPQQQFHPQLQGDECGPSASCQPTYQCGNQYRVQPLRNCRVPLDGSSGVCCSSTQPGGAVFPGSTSAPQKPQKKPISGYPQPKPSVQPFPQKPGSQTFPHTGPSQQPFPQTSPSQQPFPQTGPSHQPFPQTSPSQQTFPQTSPSQKPFSQASPSQQPFPQTSPSQQPFPQTGPSHQPFPQTSPSQQTFPHTSPSQQPFPQTGPTKQSFPHTGPSQQPFPQTSPSLHVSPSQQQFPQTSPSQQSYPQTHPSQTFPDTSPSQQPFPQTGPTKQSFPHTGPSQQPFPQTSPSLHVSPSQQQFPQTSPSQQPYPQKHPSQTFPHTSPSQQPFPQTGPTKQSFPHTGPSQQPFPQTSPSQQPFPQNLPSPQPSLQPFPQQKPSAQPFPSQPLPFPTAQPSQPFPGHQQQTQQPFPSSTPGFPNQPQSQFPGAYQPGQTGQVSPKPGAECGIRRQVSRQGLADTDAGFSEFPWQALVLSSSQKPLCSAAIISDRAVVTAAHCVQDLESSDLLVQAGVWKLNTKNQPKPIQIQHVAAIARHPNFDPSSLFSDLAILLLSAPLQFDDHVDKICLPPRGQNIGQLQRVCIATGWGKPAIQGNVPGSILHQIPVTLVPHTTCEEKLRQTHLGRYFILNPSFQCAIPAGPSQDLCKVDAGGPVACDRGDGHHELSGTYSWDIGCSVPNSPTVFGGIDTNWIESVLARPVDDVARDELNDILRQQQQQELTGVDIDNKPGFSQGYGKK